MSHRDNASFGKRQEYSIVAELLKRNFDVYMTLIDDQGIDCVVRLSEKNYLDIQIKARSKDVKYHHRFAGMRFDPRVNLYFIFYTEKDNKFWVIPSQDLAPMCQLNKSGKNAGKRTLDLPSRDDGEKAGRFRRFEGDNGFNVLRGCTGN